MNNIQPFITPPLKAQLPQTPPEQAPVQHYVYIATIQRYLVLQQDTSTLLSQPPSMVPRWPPHTPPVAEQGHTPARLFYIWPLNTPRYAARQHRPHKAISEEPGVGETLLGCGMLLVAGILMLMLLYYLSAAR